MHRIFFIAKELRRFQKKMRCILALIVGFAVTKKRHVRVEKGLEEVQQLQLLTKELQAILSIHDLGNTQEAQEADARGSRG